MISASWIQRLAWLSALLAIALLSTAAYIPIKAELAQYLLHASWQEARQTQALMRPWPWSDGKVIGKLNMAGETHFLLSEASARNLAFAPALLNSKESMLLKGNTVVVAHRDTHFKRLNLLEPGSIVEVTMLEAAHRYEVTERVIVSQYDVEILQQTEEDVLTLITCYPFDTLTADPHMRYVVRAKALKT